MDRKRNYRRLLLLGAEYDTENRKIRLTHRKKQKKVNITLKGIKFSPLVLPTVFFLPEADARLKIKS